MDEHVIADLCLRYVLKADTLADSAELHLGHEHLMLAVHLDYLAGNRETHDVSARAVRLRRRSQ